MKKTISLIIIIVMCLSLCACSTGERLDLNNYTQYLSITTVTHNDSEAVRVGAIPNVSRTVALRPSVKVEGVSSNFNYNNVKIKVRIYGSYGTTDLVSYSQDADAGSMKKFDILLELSPNIAGSGYISETIYAPLGKAIVDCDYDYEIVSISGTVKPA